MPMSRDCWVGCAQWATTSSGGGDRDRGHQVGGADLRPGAGVGHTRPGPVGGAEADDHRGQHQRHLLEQLEEPEQLGDHDQGREAEHELRQPRQRAGPRRDEQGANVEGAEAEGGGDHRQLRRAEQVLAG